MKKTTTTTTDPAPTSASPTAGGECLLIGSTKFREVAAPKVRGEPRCQFRADKRNAGTLTFNGPLLIHFPALAECARLKVFLAENGKPAVGLFPAKDKEGLVFMLDGKTGRAVRKKLQGRALAGLAEYSRIEYRVEAVESPRKGWVLHPLSSERRVPPFGAKS